MMTLYWHSLSFTHSHEYMYGNRMSAIISAVTQQITFLYTQEENALSEARGKWTCPWHLPTLVINKYFKQSCFCIKTWKNTIAYMQKNNVQNLCLQGRRWLICHPFHNCMYYIRKTCLYIENSCILSAYAAWMCWHSKWLWHLQKNVLLISQRTL